MVFICLYSGVHGSHIGDGLVVGFDGCDGFHAFQYFEHIDVSDVFHAFVVVMVGFLFRSVFWF